jgi:biotin carboxylase
VLDYDAGERRGRGARRSAIMSTSPRLSGIGDIRSYFRTLETPVYFVSATAFNLLGIDRWVRSMRYVNYFDSFDGAHPRVFVPQIADPPEFDSIEQICNVMLGNKNTHDWMAARGPGGKAVFLMFDEETEQLADELGLDVAFPPAALRSRLDSKIVTTQLANEAGVPSVPNVLGRADTYDELIALAAAGGVGDDLVVQTPYGDSGQTTFFIAAREDWERHRDLIVGEELKVMRRIDPRELAIEGVVTRHGTLVGPLLTELAGFPALTPYGGGWCGNEVFPSITTPELRERARSMTAAMGDRLAREGYRGYFELDFLLDADSGELYLGELNPRVTGASSMTNVSSIAYGDAPLFLFHLIEFMGVDYEIDVEELNGRWAQSRFRDVWTQFVLKETDDVLERLTSAPASGIWRRGEDGSVGFRGPATDWHDIREEEDAFYLRIAATGDYRYKGADLGILVTRGRFQTDDHELTPRAEGWIQAIKGRFQGTPVTTPVVSTLAEPFGFKML